MRSANDGEHIVEKQHSRVLGLPKILFATVLAALTLFNLSSAPEPAAANTGEDSFELRSNYSIASNTIEQQIRVPLPQGVTPVAVTGTLLTSPNLNGRVEVLTHNQVIETVFTNTEESNYELTFPAGLGDIEDGALVFSLRYLTADITDPSQMCLISNFGSVRFTEITVHTEGTEARPTSISDFFGSAVREIAVLIPENPEPAVQEAALNVAAAVNHRYGQETVVSVTTTLSDERAVQPTAIGGRLIEILPGSGEVTTVLSERDGISLLTLQGDPEKLSAAAVALGSDFLGALDTTQVGSLSDTLEFGEQLRRTFADLGNPGPVLSGLGQSQFFIQVDQSAFGTSVSGINLQLSGVHSRIPDSISATLSIYWNNLLIESMVLEQNESNKITNLIEIPDTRLQQSNSLRMQLDAVPRGSSSSTNAFGGLDCGGVLSILPIEVAFDGNASVFEGIPGQSLEQGFQRYPQVFGNVLPVALSGISQTAEAITDTAVLIGALQKINPRQLTIKVVSVEEFFETSLSGLMVGATTEEVDALKAPLRMASFRAIDAKHEDFGAEVTQPYAALQAFENNGRNVLLLSSWAPTASGEAAGQELQSTIVDSIAQSEFGWYGLYGDLLIAQDPAKEPVIFGSNSINPQPEVIAEFSSYLIWIVVFIGVMLLLIISGWFSRNRLKNRARRLVEAQLAAEEAEAIARQSGQYRP